MALTDTAQPAIEWFPRVAHELEVLEAGEPSWKTAAVVRLRSVAAAPDTLTADDARLLILVAAALRTEEDEGALERGLVTWKTLAAEDIDALAVELKHRVFHRAEKLDLAIAS